MKCTLQELEKLVTIDDCMDYIYELWIVLQEVEALRYCEEELFRLRSSFRTKQDFEKCEELAYEIKTHKREIDEWFRTLKEEE